MASDGNPNDVDWAKLIPTLPDLSQYKHYSVYELENVIFFKDDNGHWVPKDMQVVFEHFKNKVKP